MFEKTIIASVSLAWVQAFILGRTLDGIFTLLTFILISLLIIIAYIRNKK
jgi:hypothetical protein